MAIAGIDLGTTNSATATIWMGRPEIIPNRYGGRSTPSVVGMTRQKKILVGKKARHQRIALLGEPITEIKRKMGQNSEVPLGGKMFSPQQISGYILKTLKMDAEQFLKTKIECAVITIPAYFNESARRATRESGEMAGLNVGMVLDEPTAAALAYGVSREKEETVLVYDLGGGTFDISVIQIEGAHFEVLAIDGDPHLGGKDFDHLLLDYLFHAVKEKYAFDLSQCNDLSRLSIAVEEAKCDLSYRLDAQVIVQNFTEDMDIDIDIKRELLEELVRPLVESTLVPIERVLEKSAMSVEEIDHVLLVGGSTRMPIVRNTVQAFFKKAPRTDLNPDECVALGAALYAQLLPEETKKRYGGEMSWGKEEEDALVVVPKTAHSLGIGVDEAGSRYSVILPAGSFYPVSITRRDYFTAVDNQAGIEMWVYEGEDPVAQKNTPLGRIRLDLPRGLPAGVPIWITFGLNDSRILEVSVKLPDRPGVEAIIRIDPGSKMPEEGVQEKMKIVAVPPLQRQIDTVKQLAQSCKENLSQSRHAQIQWAILSAQAALDRNDLSLAREKVRLLAHIREELAKLEGNR